MSFEGIIIKIQSKPILWVSADPELQELGSEGKIMAGISNKTRHTRSIFIHTEGPKVSFTSSLSTIKGWTWHTDTRVKPKKGKIIVYENKPFDSVFIKDFYNLLIIIFSDA